MLTLLKDATQKNFFSSKTHTFFFRSMTNNDHVYVHCAIHTSKVSESEGDQCEVTITGGEKERERAFALV